LRLRQEQKAYIEFELRHFEQTKRDWEQLQDQIVTGSDYTISDMPRGTDVSDSTQAKAMRLCTNARLMQMERTVRAIERILTGLPEEKYKLIEMRYWTSPRTLTDDGIALEIYCNKRTMYRWIDEIMFAIAAELGIINPDYTVRR
jgi:RinA family phage transcriptional activator